MSPSSAIVQRIDSHKSVITENGIGPAGDILQPNSTLVWQEVGIRITAD